MDLASLVAAVFIFTSFGATIAFFAIKHRYSHLLKDAKAKEAELAQKAYEAEVLRGVGQQLGYFLDASKIIEIVSVSLEQLLPYSVVSYIVDSTADGKIKFWCKVREAVSASYIADLKQKMVVAFSEMSQRDVLLNEVEEGVSGGLIDDKIKGSVDSFFNLPIVVSGKLVAVITISSKKPNLYNEKNTEVLYRMAIQVSETVTKLQDVIGNEKARLSHAVESLSDGVLMVDSNLSLVLTNSSLKRMLGLSGDTIILLDIFNRLEGQLDLRTMVETATHSTAALEKKEIEVGGRFLEVMASRVVNQKTGVLMGVVVTFYDATDTKKLERLRSEFMALMVHELRSPLTTIKSTVDYINEEGLKTFKQEEIEHHLQVIRATSQSMLELVSDLLDVAKIEAGKFDVLCEPGDVAATVEAEVESFKPLAEEKKLKLDLKIDHDLPEGSFDKIRMRQVVNNLIANAIKFTGSGSVMVRVAKEVIDGRPVDILVSITDTGVGIESAEIKKLFAKFVQLGGGRDQSGVKSSGLGLFISRGIVEAMGGKIRAESAGPGLGSTFSFTIPVALENRKKLTDDEHEIIFSTKRVARA